MNIDLNINNYDLKDLLNLFQLDYNFTKDELKKAKKVVLKTHPDKSGLDKDYKGIPFGIMPQLMCEAELVTKLTAICNQCGD